MATPSRVAGMLAASLLVVVACSSSTPSGSSPRPSSADASVDASVAPAASTRPSIPTTLQDPRWIAYYDLGSGSGTAGGLSLIRADGTDMHPFVADGSRDAFHADWSPDGLRLVYALKKQDETPEIWVADRDGIDRRLLVDCQDPCAYVDDPAWSPDGTQIAFWTNTTDFDDGQWLQIVDVDTGKVVVEVHPSDLLKGPTRVRWSPDGQHLAVEVGDFAADGSDYRQTGSAIGVVDLTAPEPSIRLLTSFDLLAGYPAWSPAGDQIVFMAGNLEPSEGGAVSDLWTVRTDGTDLTQITHLPSGEGLFGPDWTAGDHQILVTWYRGAGDFNLATIDPDGANLADLADPATGKPIRGVHGRTSIALP